MSNAYFQYVLSLQNVLQNTFSTCYAHMKGKGLDIERFIEKQHLKNQKDRTQFVVEKLHILITSNI